MRGEIRDRLAGSDAPGSSSTGPGWGVGDFDLLDEIAHGGMGIVYRARDRRTGGLVALKSLPPGAADGGAHSRRFLIEVEALCQLHHPGIVRVLEAGSAPGRQFLAMELVSGRDLGRRLKSLGGPMPLREGVALVRKVAVAIRYAHERGVIHRDIKPGNILVDDQGEPRVTDFGLAKILHGDHPETLSGEVMGSPGYMAPELARGQSKHATTTADIYSLGAVLYAVITGQAPFRADTPVATLQKVISEDVRRPRAHNPEVDRDLEAICLRCLEKRPERRYASADQLVQDLEAWERGEPVQAPVAGAWMEARRWVRRNPAVTVSILLLVAALAGSVTMLAWVSHQKQLGEALQQALARTVMTDLNRLWDSAKNETSPEKRYLDVDSPTRALLRGSDAPATAGATRLVFGVYTHDPPPDMLAIIGPALVPLEQEVSQRLGLRVLITLRIYGNYQDAQEAIVRGDIDLMRVGSSTYIEAHDRDPGIEILAAQNGRIQGCIFVRSDSGIGSLEGLKGRSMGFVDDSSTTGFYLAKHRMLLAGLRASDLRGGATNFLGNHSAVGQAVLKGRFDAGAASANNIDPMTNSGLREVLRYAEPLGMPWIARSGLDRRMVEAFRTALLGLRDPKATARLGNGTTGFSPAADADYNSLREAMRESLRFDLPR